MTIGVAPTYWRRIVLAARPVGPIGADNFRVERAPSTPLGPDEVSMAVRFISIEPAMSGWMGQGPSYLPHISIGGVMRAVGVGHVLESRSPRFETGDWVSAATGVQEIFTAPEASFRKLPKGPHPIERHLGALGLPGWAAYFGLLDIGKPKEGETVLVSSAAGAVGSMVGQIAKAHGCRTIGVAGGPDKCRQLLNLYGFDGAIDYKAESLRLRLRELCPSGIDIYFDNVGGELLEIALSRLKSRGRIVLSGAVSQYAQLGSASGPRNYMSLVLNSGVMQGFLVSDYFDRADEAISGISHWLETGEIAVKENIIHGIENFPRALSELLSGTHSGKLILSI